MSELIVTYHSQNAKPDREWVAYVDLGADYLGIRFHGTTEAEATTKAIDFWAADRAKRDQVQANREAGRRAAADRRALSISKEG